MIRKASGGALRRRSGRYATTSTSHRGDRRGQRSPATRPTTISNSDASRRRDLGVLVEARSTPQVHIGGERADHEDLGVREVDQAQHAVDQRVAQRDQRVDRALGQPGDRQLREVPDQIRRSSTGRSREIDQSRPVRPGACAPGRTGGPIRGPDWSNRMDQDFGISSSGDNRAGVDLERPDLDLAGSSSPVAVELVGHAGRRTGLVVAGRRKVFRSARVVLPALMPSRKMFAASYATSAYVPGSALSTSPCSP